MRGMTLLVVLVWLAAFAALLTAGVLLILDGKTALGVTLILLALLLRVRYDPPA